MRNWTLYKGVIRSRESALVTEDEITSALGKQGVTNIRRISIRKANNESRPTLSSWHLISPILPRRLRLALVLRELSSRSQFPWAASNPQNMDTTGKPVEDNRHVWNAVNRTQTTWRKIARKKLDVQTANKEITAVKCVLPGRKENFGELYGRKQLCLCCAEVGENQWRQQI